MIPFFSIILPTYNRAEMLQSAIYTVKFQTFQSWELLIIDDGSTDRTEETVRRWLDDPRIKYVKLDHVGNMAARNVALEMAKGDWITNIDSDDFWLPNRLEEFARHVSFWGPNKWRPSVGFVFSNGYVHRYGRIIGKVFDPKRNIPAGRVPGYFAVGMEYLPYLTANLAIKRHHFLEHGGCYRRDMKILDNEIYARMLHAGVEVGVINEPLAVRRIHEGQVTNGWVEEYPEARAALESGMTGLAKFYRELGKLRRSVAVCLIKSGQPEKARKFIDDEGLDLGLIPAYCATYVPPAVLKLGARARRHYLRLRHHPLLAGSDLRKVYALIDPLIDVEGMLG